MNYVRVKSYAKINLTLDICGRTQGYHLLDSVVASVDLYDVIAVKKRRDSLISVTMRGQNSENIPYGQNNVVRAAELFIEKFGCNGVDISVSKNIPIGAGLGGSSADAAGVLRAMAKLYEIEDGGKISSLAAQVGSDCPYMLKGGFARLSGRGEKVTPIACEERLYLGLLLPKKGVSAAECYREFDSGSYPATATSDELLSALTNGDITGVGKYLSNSLYAPACAICPDIKGAFEYLKGFDPLGVSMTGSGSCVFALFENDQFVQYANSRNGSGFKFIPAKTVIPAVR